MRSWLFTPGTRIDRYDGARRIGADVAILDLEDSVAASQKPDARNATISYLETVPKGHVSWALRLNPPTTRAGLADLSAVLDGKADPDYIIIPKTESSSTLRLFDDLLTETGKSSKLIGLIESAEGLRRADKIARATPRLIGLLFGAADMVADLGCASTWNALSHARARLVSACACAQVIPIDSPFFDIADTAGLCREIEQAREFGFIGKAAIHPCQISHINNAFSPSSEDIMEAQEILEKSAIGVGVIGDSMIDEAMARKARRVLAAATSYHKSPMIHFPSETQPPITRSTRQS